jgi:hypothetical protein
MHFAETDTEAHFPSAISDKAIHLLLLRDGTSRFYIVPSDSRSRDVVELQSTTTGIPAQTPHIKSPGGHNDVFSTELYQLFPVTLYAKV